MSNFLYVKGIENIGKKLIDLESSLIRVQPVETGSGGYVVSQSSDDALSDVPVAARIGSPAALTNPTFTDGVFDADNVVCSNSEFASVGALVIYQEDPGSPQDETQALLIAYIDTASGLPYTTGGLDIPITWSNGANKIFKIG